MALEGFQPFVLRTFGGLCTLIDRLSLGVGQSPNCQNVSFFPGTVSSRYAYEKFTQYNSSEISTGSPMYSIKPFVTKSGQKQLLYLTSYGATTGTLYVRTTSGASSLLAGIGTDRPLSIKADSLFGKLYIAITDGRPLADGVGGGVLRTLVYDGTSIKEMAPDAPAWATDSAPYDAYVNVVAGAGGLAVGAHYYLWLFQMETGYITRVGTGGVFTVSAAGTSKLNVVNAPIGPSGTVARILAITPANDTNFFWVPNKTFIVDNTTKNFSITLSEDELLIGEPVRPYFTLYTPSAPSGVVVYSNRVILYGCLDKSEMSTVAYPYSMLGSVPNVFQVIGPPNLSFNGGFQTASNRYPDIPYYWQPYVLGTGFWSGFGPGANTDTLLIKRDTAGGAVPVLGDGVQVTKDIDYTYLKLGQKVGIRVRARRSANLVTGAASAAINVYDTSSTLVPSASASVSLTANTIGTDYSIVAGASSGTVASLGEPTGTLATIRVQVRCGNAFGEDQSWIEIDWIEIFDASDTSHQSLLRLSRAGDPESFDFATGIISVGPDDGEGIRNCFRLRDALYICKERSLYATRDTGEEPIAWPVELVDRLSGTPSAHGVGYGDGWVVIAARVGLVLFDGATPQIISQEITPTWNTIDWSDPNFVWVNVDPSTKQIKIGAKAVKQTPVATEPNNLLFCLDYVEGFGNPVPSGEGRKWSIDTVDSTKAGTSPAYHQGVMLLNTSGTPIPVYSMSATPSSVTTPDTGTELNVITYQATGRNDFPDAQKEGQGVVRATYETAPIGSEIGRSVFDRFVARIRGSGTLAASYVKPSGSTVTIAPSYNPPYNDVELTSTPEHDVEIGANTHMTSVGVRIGVASRSDWFSLRRLGVYIKESVFGSQRGKTDHNSV